MKHDELRAIAHNAAASLASDDYGQFSIPGVNVFAVANEAPSGAVTVDFLRGTVVGSSGPSAFVEAVALFPAILASLCERHRTAPSAFKELTVRYWVSLQGTRFTVIVADQTGRTTATEYGEHDGQRVKSVDELGRLRPKAIKRV